jgi:UDP-MurNAc hydroxylase
MANLTFINHASYLIETEQSILLVDPWVEGDAFDNGWSLLDKSITNSKLLKFLAGTAKKIYIWYSHEHSDHFSVSFLKMLQKKIKTSKFIFQKTLDGRVAQFIRTLGFQVIESNDRREFIDSELSIVTFPYSGGDSYSLTMLRDISILNINDCVVNNKESINAVISNFKKFTNKIDILLTQFGYANWVGNIDEKHLRVSSAREKLNRILLQVQKFCPGAVIPFASFVYFSELENFHTNDSQNTPMDVFNLFQNHKISSKLIVLKPWDKLDLTKRLDQEHSKRECNIEHWTKLFKDIKPNEKIGNKISIDLIEVEYKAFRKKIFKHFLIGPNFLERIGFIKPITLYLKDLDLNFGLSYCHKIKIEAGDKSVCDISCSSATFRFILKNEYGLNTTLVNGKFERISEYGVELFSRYFSPQEYIKMGYGLKRPFLTIKIILGKILHRAKREKWVINPSTD